MFRFMSVRISRTTKGLIFVSLTDVLIIFFYTSFHLFKKVVMYCLNSL